MRKRCGAMCSIVLALVLLLCGCGVRQQPTPMPMPSLNEPTTEDILDPFGHIQMGYLDLTPQQVLQLHPDMTVYLTEEFDPYVKNPTFLLRRIWNIGSDDTRYFEGLYYADQKAVGISWSMTFMEDKAQMAQTLFVQLCERMLEISTEPRWDGIYGYAADPYYDVYDYSEVPIEDVAQSLQNDDIEQYVYRIDLENKYYNRSDRNKGYQPFDPDSIREDARWIPGLEDAKVISISYDDNYDYAEQTSQRKQAFVIVTIEFGEEVEGWALEEKPALEPNWEQLPIHNIEKAGDALDPMGYAAAGYYGKSPREIKELLPDAEGDGAPCMVLKSRLTNTICCKQSFYFDEDKLVEIQYCYLFDVGEDAERKFVGQCRRLYEINKRASGGFSLGERYISLEEFVGPYSQLQHVTAGSGDEDGLFWKEVLDSSHYSSQTMTGFYTYCDASNTEGVNREMAPKGWKREYDINIMAFFYHWYRDIDDPSYEYGYCTLQRSNAVFLDDRDAMIVLSIATWD